MEIISRSEVMNIVQIVEMDQERDRKTCINLDLKVTGANRELAQWLLDHPRYSGAVVAEWLGCRPRRIERLRKWAKDGFIGTPRSKDKENPSARTDLSLESLDNSEDGEDSEVAEPEVIEEHLFHVIGGINENARVFNKLLRASAFDREAASRLAVAIDRMIGKWRSVQSILERKG